MRRVPCCVTTERGSTVDAYEHFLSMCPLHEHCEDTRRELREAHRAMVDLAADSKPANLRWSLAERRAEWRLA